MWQGLGQVVNTKTLRHFFITSGGTIVNGLLGLLFYIVVARALGPSAFGVLAIAIAGITLLSDIGDMGMDTGVIRFVGKYRGGDEQAALKFIKLGLEVKLAIWIIILAGGWLLVPPVAGHIFLKSELVLPLRLALVGVGGAMVFSLLSHAIQAYQRFWLWSVVNVGTNSVRLLAILVLIYLGSLNIYSTLVIYIAVLFLGFFTALFLLPNFITARGESQVGQEFFRYSKWVALTGIMAAAGSRVDTFISARFLTTRELGIYSVAGQLTTVVPQLVFALATVVAPKLATFDTNQKALTYLKKLQLLAGGLFILGILAIPVISAAIPLIYGAVYRDSIAPFVILFVAQLIFLQALPSHQAIFYYFAKPKFFIWVAAAQLLTGIFLGWFLISRFGIIGAASTVLTVNILSFIIPTAWVIYLFNKNKKG